MLKKTITYTNFNDVEVSEDFYFHLSHADLIELEMSKKGGMEKYIQAIIAADDRATIMAEFKKIILLSYGQKSDDGSKFIRNNKIREEFESSEAYSELMMELCTNAGAAAEFINGIVPKNFEARFVKKQEQKAQSVNKTPEIKDVSEPRVITRAEMDEMDADEFKHLIAQGATIAPEM